MWLAICIIIGKAEPALYISSTPDIHNLSCIYSTGKCSYYSASIVCPHGELLLDGVKQINLEDGVTNSDVQKFYTWRKANYVHDDRVLVTLMFSTSETKPTKVAVYCLESSHLDAGGPKYIRLALFINY